MTRGNFFFLLSLLSVVIGVLSHASTIPVEWQAKVNQRVAFFAEDDSGALIMDGYPKGLYLPLMGNGFISHAKGVRSDAMYISGVFNGETTSPSHRARIPASLAVTAAEHKPIGVLLDIESGIYHRRGTINNSQSWYEMRWYAHRSMRNIYVMELEVHLDSCSGSVTLNLTNNRGADSADISFGAENEIKDASTPGGAFSVCGKTNIPETSDNSVTSVCLAGDRIPSTLIITKTESGKVYTFLTSYRTSLDLDTADLTDIENKALEDYQSAHTLAASTKTSAGKISALQYKHTSAWSSLWASGIEITGRDDVSAAINASLYAILSSVRDDWAYGLAPGGLTNYYNGHAFWDTETWMYPPLLFLHPSVASSLLQYRFDRLDGARKKAKSYSPPFDGTMFPWESAYSGVETCPTWAPTGSREDHISGDIALAVWQTYIMTGDKEWLRNVGYPILVGVADFWVSRSTFETDGKPPYKPNKTYNLTTAATSSSNRVAHILDIIPPDEYVDHVNDSVYSNFVASKALRYAVAASQVLGEACGKCASYQELADSLVILFDSELNIHPEYAGYPGNTVKQADVVLLHYPLALEMEENVQRADLDYYSERTDIHGPAMTWGMHAIGFLDLNDFENAAKFFNMSFQDNMHDPLQVWTETPDGNAVNFITGAGGFLQTMINGYPGFRITDNGLTMKPYCPEGATSVKLRSFSYLGNTFTFEYNCDAKNAQPQGFRLTQHSKVVASQKRHFKLETTFRGEAQQLLSQLQVLDHTGATALEMKLDGISREQYKYTSFKLVPM